MIHFLFGCLLQKLDQFLFSKLHRGSSIIILLKLNS